MISCLLFDLDGTLFDSSEANVAAYAKAFSQADVPFSEDQYRVLFGLKFDEMVEQVAPGLSQSQKDKIKDLKAKYYKENLSLVRPNQGLIALAQSLRSSHKIGLVTTARKVNVNNLMEFHNLDSNLFDLIITAEDVVNGKPDPECYIKAMTALNKKPEECCIFEDSQSGIEAAQKSGAYVVVVKI